jgi:hypothetical protein
MYKKVKGKTIMTNKLLIPLSNSVVPMAVRPSAVAVIINPILAYVSLRGFHFLYH